MTIYKGHRSPNTIDHKIHEQKKMRDDDDIQITNQFHSSYKKYRLNILTAAMFGKLMQIFNGDDDKPTIYRILRRVRFDIDLDQNDIPFEKYIALSPNIQDSKGNSGYFGTLILTNLRVIWHLKNDPTTNLSFGLDAITLVDLKTTPTHVGSGVKYILTIKVQNINHSRYQFKFTGCHIEQLNTFNKIAEIYKKIANSKYFRSICLNVKYENEYQLMNGQQLKNIYHDSYFVQESTKYISKLIVTNIRFVIIKQGQKKMNFGISWLAIKNIQCGFDHDSVKGIRLECHGQLLNKLIIVGCKKFSDTKKLEQEMKSFWETCNKSPIIGFAYEEENKNLVKATVEEYCTDTTELEATKVKLIQRKKAYTSVDGLSSVSNTQFNEELGLMVEKFPEGLNRKDLWEILK